MGITPLAPQASASANSATFAPGTAGTIGGGEGMSRSRLPAETFSQRLFRARSAFVECDSLSGAARQIPQNRENLAHLEGFANPGGHHAERRGGYLRGGPGNDHHARARTVRRQVSERAPDIALDGR